MARGGGGIRGSRSGQPVTVLIDDQLLAAHLRGLPVLRDHSGPVFTSGYWYVRLCLAVGRRTAGRLSGPFLALPPARRRRALTAVLSLPQEIGLLSLRRLGPVIGELAQRHPPMNALTREALAAAVVLEAEVLMAGGNENFVLATGVAEEGLHARVVALDGL